MSGLMQTIRCWATGECGEPEDPVQTIQTTQQLLREVDEEMAPLRRRIDEESRGRSPLAEALREAHRERGAL